jgi:hypothetical protein
MSSYSFLMREDGQKSVKKESTQRLEVINKGQRIKMKTLL